MEWKITVEEGIDSKSVQARFCDDVIRRSFQAFRRSAISFCRRISQVGANDPRTVIHSIKVGLALSLVSVFYFVRPLFDSVGGNAVWAVMTVVVVFEFTVGATMCKGLNRSCATLLAGLLGVGVNCVAELAGKNCELVILGISIFVLGAASTYSRFFPVIKQRYDYGVVIFILTFNLIAISGYRAENLFKLAHQRLSTIVIGCAFCLLINVFAFPIWAGDDLHNSIIRNLEGLGGSLQEYLTEYFVESKDAQDLDDDKLGRGYKCVLNSKATEESRMNFATWEPSHGRFFFRYPWNLYIKVGNATRYCAYCVEALDGLLNSEIQAPVDVRENFKTPFMEIGKGSAEILRELAESIRMMRKITNAHLMLDRLTTVVENLQNSLRAKIAEENHLKSAPNFQEVLTRTNKSHASSIPNRATLAGEVNASSSGNIFEGEIDEDGSVNQAGNIYEMIEMKRNNFELMEFLPIASFSALLIEILARLEKVIIAVEELGEKANFENIEHVKVPPPSTSSQTNKEGSSRKQIVPVTLSPTVSSATTTSHHLLKLTPTVRASKAKIDKLVKGQGAI